MPAITDPNEPYFKDGIWGWNAAGNLWMPLAVDPGTGYLYVLPRGVLEVHQDTPADMQVGTHGWDGAAWHKLAMVWGYSDVLAQGLYANNVGAGTYTYNFPAVPAGEIWVVTRIATYSVQTDPTYALIAGVINALEAVLYFQPHTTANSTHHVDTDTILNEGDNIRVSWYSCLAGTDIRASVVGYKMLIAE